jgi:hypothetical protein
MAPGSHCGLVALPDRLIIFNAATWVLDLTLKWCGGFDIIPNLIPMVFQGF